MLLHETLLRRRLTTVLFIITDFHFIITNNMQITVGYKTVSLLLLSHDRETWPLILRGEKILRLNKKMFLSKIFLDKLQEFS